MTRSRWLSCSATLLLAACREQQVAPSAFPEHSTVAASEAARTYGPSVGKGGGIWLVEDADGDLVAAGVVKHFPSKIDLRSYARVVPAAKGHDVVGFGTARTPNDDAGTPYRLVYVRVARGGTSPGGV